VALSAEAQRALDNDLVIDITTVGRRTGEPRTVEMWFHRLEGRYYITGWPGTRGWYANLLANPMLTVTFKQSATASIKTVVRLVTDPDERRQVLEALYEIEGGAEGGDFDSWLASSPVIEFTPAN
jgi:deazaflavin-dependent oxidoreductase (nitroreductase family)